MSNAANKLPFNVLPPQVTPLEAFLEPLLAQPSGTKLAVDRARTSQRQPEPSLAVKLDEANHSRVVSNTKMCVGSFQCRFNEVKR